MINLNKESVSISEMPFGKTQNIECRLGRSLYMLDVDKNACTVHVSFYRRLNSDREKYSKYDPAAQCCMVTVAQNAILDWKFFDNIYAIMEARHESPPRYQSVKA